MSGRGLPEIFVSDVHPLEHAQRLAYLRGERSNLGAKLTALTHSSAPPSVASRLLEISSGAASSPFSAADPRSIRGIATHLLPCRQIKRIRASDERVYCCLWTSSTGRLASASQGDEIHIHALHHFSKPEQTIRAREVQWAVSSVDVSPDESFLVYSSMSPQANLVKLNTETASTAYERLDFSGPAPSVAGAVAGEGGDDDDDEGAGGRATFRAARGGGGNHRRSFAIFQLRFSAGGTEVVAACGDNSVTTYDIEKSRVVDKRSNAHKDDVNSIAFVEGSFKSNLIASGSDDCMLCIWDRRMPSSSPPALYLPGHQEGITSVASKGDGCHLLTNSKDQSMKLWDIRAAAGSTSAKPYRPPYAFDYRWQGYPGTSPSAPPTWHPEDRSILTMRGHSVLQTLIRCNFSPAETTGQRYAYTGSADGIARIYDLTSGDMVRSLYPLTSSSSASFSGGGGGGDHDDDEDRDSYGWHRFASRRGGGGSSSSATASSGRAKEGLRGGRPLSYKSALAASRDDEEDDDDDDQEIKRRKEAASFSSRRPGGACVRDVAWHPLEPLLASACFDGSVKVFSVDEDEARGQVVALKQLKGTREAIVKHARKLRKEAMNRFDEPSSSSSKQKRKEQQQAEKEASNDEKEEDEEDSERATPADKEKGKETEHGTAAARGSDEGSGAGSGKSDPELPKGSVSSKTSSSMAINEEAASSSASEEEEAEVTLEEDQVFFRRLSEAANTAPASSGGGGGIRTRAGTVLPVRSFAPSSSSSSFLTGRALQAVMLARSSRVGSAVGEDEEDEAEEDGDDEEEEADEDEDEYEEDEDEDDEGGAGPRQAVMGMLLALLGGSSARARLVARAVGISGGDAAAAAADEEDQDDDDAERKEEEDDDDGDNDNEGGATAKAEAEEGKEGANAEGKK
jgi:DDB1- and CUL4-associated factor 11